jgi:hypothetical protein
MSPPVAARRWKKLGKVFDPANFSLPNGCRVFAQSPQTLLLDDRVRVYFCTRSADVDGGKFRSHVAFVDMSRDIKHVLGVSTHTVVEPGGLGCFDEHGIFPINVVRHRNAILGYTCGWSRRVSVSVETSIGLVESVDGGLTFERVGTGPVLTASVHEPFLVGDGFVRVIGDVFHMWYIFGICWKRYSEDAPPDRIYKIGHATSADGVNWQTEGGRAIIADRLGPDESQALPSVIEIAGRHHMFFCYRPSSDFRTNPARGYRIGHAISDDLQHWIRDDEDPAIDVTDGAWDSDMMCYPHVFECDDRIHLLYNGNQFGRHGFGLATLE